MVYTVNEYEEYLKRQGGKTMIYNLDMEKTLIEQEFDKKFDEIIKYKKLKPIVSYTTRPIRNSEVQNREHIFISNEEADRLLEDSSKILAYTKIGDNRYFALVDQLQDYNAYIIDPKGLKNLKEIHPELKIKSIYITLDSDTRAERYLGRIGKPVNEDTIKEFNERDKSESEQFDEFEREDKDHITINNNNLYMVNTVFNIFYYIYKNYTDDTLFCFLGRTASGKDTLVKKVCELFGN